ncbi:MAG: MBOAT family protein [Archangiaceae bacterium]|nr:MBOAT family protein [Archangiaceae bacterium]
MMFHSVQFMLLVALTFGAYWAVYRHKWQRMGVLLVASLAFYAAWKPGPLVLFIGYALVNFASGQALARLEKPWARKAVLLAALTWHLGGLFLFKYLDLVITSLARPGAVLLVLGNLVALYGVAMLLAWVVGRWRIVTQVGAVVGALAVYAALAWWASWRLLEVLDGIDWPEPPRQVNLLLPVGLSFVAFQAVSYVVDVYRGDASGRYTLFHHLVFKLFFPQVVAGPIVRSKDLMDHIDETPSMTPEEGAWGLFRIAQGVAKKLLIADVMGVALIDRVYANPQNFSSLECVLATIAYTFYIYFDFSAYSDIAIGAAALFGFKFPENFNKPYHGRNLFEFWNRWHVSLSTWLRDYLYRPLGGNQGTRFQTLRNTMLVMSFGGLWHGATGPAGPTWKYLLWGAIHGVLLMLTRVKWWVFGKPKYEHWWQVAIGWSWMMFAVIFARVFFRADSVDKALDVFRQMLKGSLSTANVSSLAWGGMAAALVFYFVPRPVFVFAGETFVKLPVVARAAALVALGLIIRQIASFETQPYVYFQF